MSKKNFFEGRIFWIGVFIFLWELSAKSGRISPLLLPDIESVVKELVRAFVSGELLAQTGYSLLLILCGMLISLLLAFVLSVAAFSSKLLFACTDTLCVLAHPLPAIALLPLIILWFGTGYKAMLAIIVHSVLWPMLLNLNAGFRAIPQIYVQSARSLGIRGARLMSEVYIPACTGYAIAGIKIGWARAWRAFISAEMVFGAAGGSGGIGWYLFKSRVLMNTPGIFAGVLTVIVIGILVEELLLSKLERVTVTRWGMAGGASQ